MQRDIGAHVKGCDVCQRKSKYKPKRAPVVKRPVLSEPFEDVAVDIVGPLAKGRGGCRFLLTYVCLATRWPEAVPLRSVTSQVVEEALVSIFSKTSIPERMMTDQGSQFCSRTLKQVCELFGVQQIRTSPYHPETNGAVERMHGNFQRILGKCVENVHEWVGQVPYVLFILRQMPHADSGFSPFDLVYGFRVRTPLEALYYGLHEASYEKMNMCSWVRHMAERLELMRDCAEAKLLKGKKSRLRLANKGTKLREFGVGDKVLYRIPGWSCKLADS